MDLFVAIGLLTLLLLAVLYARRRQRPNLKLPEKLCSLVRAEFLPQTKVVDGLQFPLTLVPLAPDLDRLWFVTNHRSELLALVRTYGAVLLRGWSDIDPEHFSKVVHALGLTETDMACSAGPRFEVANKVFTANEAPPSERIPFHHEMAQCDAPPDIVLFFCEQPAFAGGATPILKSHLAANYLREHHPAVAERLAKEGVRYVRIMPPVTDTSSALGKSWRNALRVETPEQAEAALQALGSTWEWLDHTGGMLKTTTKQVPALLVEDRSGREVFFTAAETTFNAISDEANGGGEESGATIRPIKAIIYGDGSPLDTATGVALNDVSKYMVTEQVAVPWQAGDIFVLDNASVQHSRETFTPPRRILASLVGGLSKTHNTLRSASTPEAEASKLPPATAQCSPSSTMDLLPNLNSIPILPLNASKQR